MMTARLRPAQQLEVMMQRRHLEHPLAGELEGGDLDDHREGFHHEEAADDREQDFLLGHHGGGRDRRAQRQRADVAHDHLGGMTVEPEKPQGRSDQSAAEDGELSGLGYVRDLEIAGGDGVARDVGEHAVRRAGDAHVAPIARPSRPSVRFTAFDEPTTTTATNGI
jgi:hypothetical protein